MKREKKHQIKEIEQDRHILSGVTRLLSVGGPEGGLGDTRSHSHNILDIKRSLNSGVVGLVGADNGGGTALGRGVVLLEEGLEIIGVDVLVEETGDSHAGLGVGGSVSTNVVELAEVVGGDLIKRSSDVGLDSLELGVSNSRETDGGSDKIDHISDGSGDRVFVGTNNLHAGGSVTEGAVLGVEKTLGIDDSDTLDKDDITGGGALNGSGLNSRLLEPRDDTEKRLGGGANKVVHLVEGQVLSVVGAVGVGDIPEDGLELIKVLLLHEDVHIHAVTGIGAARDGPARVTEPLGVGGETLLLDERRGGACASKGEHEQSYCVGLHAFYRSIKVVI